jgi:peptidoglycan hydrolase-like protein with peptidoglycan-binding domain
MRSRQTAALVAGLLALAWTGSAVAANPQVAGLQVALKAHGLYAGSIDGVSGPGTVAAVKLFQAQKGLAVDGRAGQRTRAALGPLGRPLLGRRDLARGAVGFDVSVLQFLLRARGFCSDAPTGAFDARTAAAVKAFQRAQGLAADGIAGRRTLAALAGQGVPVARRQPSTRIYVVRPGESLTAIAARFGTTLGALARTNRLDPARVLFVGTRLRVPGRAAAASATRASNPARTTASGGTYVVRTGDSLTAIASRHGTSVAALARANDLDPGGFLLIGTRLRVPAAVGAGAPASREEVRAALDRWSARYGVDPQLARALAWMESGFQNHVVSSAGARGIMQLLPSASDFVQTVLLGQRLDLTTVDGNIQAGVRLLAHLLREVGGDARLALAAWYQGLRAVRERGVLPESEAFVADVLALRGRV